MSKNYIFGKDDIDEMLFMLQVKVYKIVDNSELNVQMYFRMVVILCADLQEFVQCLHQGHAENQLWLEILCLNLICEN